MLYILINVARIIKMAWIVLSAAIGATVGLFVVPVMADIAEGWAKKSHARRIGFVVIWFLPLILLFFSGLVQMVMYPSLLDLQWEELIKVKIMLVLSAALVTVLLARVINPAAEPIIDFVAKQVKMLKHVVQKIYAKLGWPIPEKTRCGGYQLHKQFICSGLVQEALVETARQKGVPIEDVVVNPEWSPNQSTAEQSCVIRDTLPKHFALDDKFTWTYLYLDGVLTPNPSPSHKAQAFTRPLDSKRRHLTSNAVWAIQCGFTGVFLTIVASVINPHLSGGVTQQLMKSFDSVTKSALESSQLGLLVLAVLLGFAAILFARNAQRDLAVDPSARGRALTIYGFVSGAAATVIALANLTILSSLSFPFLNGLIATVLLIGIGSGFLLLF